MALFDFPFAVRDRLRRRAFLNGIRRQNAIRMVLCLRSRPLAGSTLVAQVTFTPGKPRPQRQINMTPGRFAADPVLATHKDLVAKPPAAVTRRTPRAHLP